jgi:hypothetical protein
LATLIAPELKYTGITINVDYEALPHYDCNNSGYSCVVAFGDYTGGELHIDGKDYDLRHRPFHFCAASTLHSVKPITSGTRYSVVFYKTKFPNSFTEMYGDSLSYDELLSLIPECPPGTPLSEQKILF